MKRLWIALGLLLTTDATAAPRLVGLGDLPAPYSTGALHWVSDSGLAGGGMYDLDTQSSDAIVFSIDSGLQSLADLTGGSSEVVHIAGGSRDGSTLVGRMQSGSGVLGFRYRDGSGVEPLEGRPDVETHDVWAHDFASDADRVVGTADSIAAIWDAALELHLLGGLHSTYPHSYGYGISADGTRVIGKSWNDQFHFQAFLWTEASGMIAIGPSVPGPAPYYSEADAISADGSIVVGITTEFGDYAPFLWDEVGGTRPLALSPGQAWISTYDSFFDLDLTADGSILVGGGLHSPGDPNNAFISTEAGGVRLLSEHLTALGADLDGWVLTSARGISENGRYIVGSGIDPEGRVTGWLVDLPEPSTSTLLWMGVAGVVSLGRRRSFKR